MKRQVGRRYLHLYLLIANGFTGVSVWIYKQQSQKSSKRASLKEMDGENEKHSLLLFPLKKTHGSGSSAYYESNK